MKTQTIQLQSVGHVPAIPASEMKAGDLRMYNFGSTNVVVKVIDKSALTLTYIVYDAKSNKYYMGDMRKTSLVAIVASNQDVSMHNPKEASAGRKGMIDVSEYFKVEVVEAAQAEYEITATIENDLIILSNNDASDLEKKYVKGNASKSESELLTAYHLQLQELGMKYKNSLPKNYESLINPDGMYKAICSFPDFGGSAGKYVIEVTGHVLKGLIWRNDIHSVITPFMPENKTEDVKQDTQKQIGDDEMKTLIFEGAGWEGADSSIQSGVGNCRIRTRIRNNEGRVIYLEMGGTIKSWNEKRDFAKGLTFIGRTDHCFYADSKWDSNRSYSEGLRDKEQGHFEYSKENILKFVNENLNCSFDFMEVINDNSVRVHDTKEPLCDCSNGDYEPYNDIEININMLNGVKPLQDYPKQRFAQYKINYDFVKEHKHLKKWIGERDKREQDQFPNYNYYTSLRYDEKGNITSAEISARQNFCSMGLGLESLKLIINDIIKMNQQVLQAV